MDILSITIIIFCIMEFSNVVVLYFFTDYKIANSVAFFDTWDKIKKEEDTKLFGYYMVYWVAGVKLIFIFLLLIIAFLGSELLKIFAIISMILSISTYFFKLHHIIKKLDEMNKITPKNYSKILDNMIIIFLLMFSFSLFIYYINLK